MVFARIGQPDHETPAVMVTDDPYVDISEIADDIDGDFLAAVDLAAMESLVARAVDAAVVEPEPTDEQRAAIARLETLLALVEGWVDDVVTQAVADRLPSSPSLREAIQRRRAVGGPSEKTFATLVGMQLRPRAMREAATVFAAMRSMKGVEARDARWGHPDLLPSTEDLEDPLGFVQGTGEPQV